MKEILDMLISGIAELLFWKNTEEYIQSDKKNKHKAFLPLMCFWCAVVGILGLIIVGVYEIIEMNIISGMSLMISAGGSIFYLWYRIDAKKNSKDAK